MDNTTKKEKGAFEDPDFWDVRFKEKEYVYGTSPNEFFRAELNFIEPGKALIVAAGEGRNAVYAAEKGWEVDAIDFSTAGKSKTIKLASLKQVKVNYVIADIAKYKTTQKYDLITFFFFHPSPEEKKRVFRRYIPFLNIGGKIILEMYTPEQLGRNSGGPKKRSHLMSKAELADIFQELDILKLEEFEGDFNEGAYHQGISNTCRVIASLSK